MRDPVRRQVNEETEGKSPKDVFPRRVSPAPIEPTQEWTHERESQQGRGDKNRSVKILQRKIERRRRWQLDALSGKDARNQKREGSARPVEPLPR